MLRIFAGDANASSEGWHSAHVTIIAAFRRMGTAAGLDRAPAPVPGIADGFKNDAVHLSDGRVQELGKPKGGRVSEQTRPGRGPAAVALAT